MALTDRLRSVAGWAGQRLSAYSSRAAPPVPGLEAKGISRHRGANPQIARQLRSMDALFGRTTYGAGPSLTRYSTYPGTALEPDSIYAILRLRDSGYPWQWAELCEQIIERDGHLRGAHDTRRQEVADEDLRVHPRNETPLAEAVANFCRAFVEAIDAFDQSMEDLLGANANGYGCSELVYEFNRLRFPGPNGSVSLQALTPRRLDWVHPKHFRFDQVNDEPLLTLGGGGDYALPWCKFIFHAATGTGFIERRGYMGACVWLHAAKHWALRDWLVYAHLFGLPTVIGKYPGDVEQYEEHRTILETILRNIGQGIPAIVPDDVTVEIGKTAEGGRVGDVHGAIAGFCNAEMSKLVLGAQLAMESGGNGSYAQASVHADRLYGKVKSDARKLAQTLRADLFEPVVELNVEALAGALGASPDEIRQCIPLGSWRIEREMGPIEVANVYDVTVNKLGIAVDEDQYLDRMAINRAGPGKRAIRGEPVQVGTGGLVPSTEASRTGAEPPPKEAPPSGGRAPGKE